VKIKVIFERKPIKDTIEDYLYTHITDSATINNIQVVYLDNKVVKPTLIVNKIYIAPGQLYSQLNVDESYKSLLSLRIFKSINITFTEDSTVAPGDYKVIDCRIQLITTDFQSYQTEAELTNSEGIGVEGSLVYQHKNFFKGAEIFSLKLHGATEAVKNSTAIKFKNTLELGSEAKIEFPKYLLPFRTEQFIRRYNPKTYLSVAYGFQRRIYYTNSIANLSFGYNWSGNSYTNFIVSPFDINYVKLIDTTQGFYNQITGLSQKYSRTDHLVSVTGFSFTYNNQRFKKNSEFYFFRLNAETAGNTMRLLSEVSKANKDSSGAYKLFTVRFAQYVKGDVDYRYYQPLNQTDRMVYRVFIGVAYPYGNSKLVPFERQYYTGGANSIRAWQEGKLGPGSYKDASNYPDARADIKLEGNMEYRFKLFWILEGAFFLDAGNIWAINKNDKRVGTLFKFNHFLSQIAVGTGFGTRFDFSFFVFRLDLGLKLRDPSVINHPWSFNRGSNDTRPFIDLLNPTLGIGYPF
jgi:outer membrane protein assembly factor BamA